MSAMGSFKLIVLGVFAALGVFCAIFYSSCAKDGCKGVTCLNYGTCSGGVCSCIQGIGGNNCETVYRRLYANTYAGNAIDDSGTVYLNSTLVFSEGTDTTNFNNMELRWVNPVAGRTIQFKGIKLSNNLSTGSNFVIDTTKPASDTNTYAGNGSVNGNVATLQLIVYHPNASPTLVNFNNFNKQ